MFFRIAPLINHPRSNILADGVCSMRPTHVGGVKRRRAVMLSRMRLVEIRRFGSRSMAGRVTKKKGGDLS